MTGNSDDTIIWRHYSFLLHCNKKQTNAGFHMVSQIIMWRDSQHLHHVLHLYPYIHSPSAENQNQDVWVHIFATHITSRYSHVFHIYISYHQFLATPLEINMVHLKYPIEIRKIIWTKPLLNFEVQNVSFPGCASILVESFVAIRFNKKTNPEVPDLPTAASPHQKHRGVLMFFEVAGFLIGFHDDFQR